MTLPAAEGWGYPFCCGTSFIARVAALEWGADHIRVNVLHPNQVFDTGIWTEDVLRSRAAHYGLTVEQYKTNNVLKTASLPTAAGHVQWMLPVGQGLELGVSGAVGPQTGQADAGIAQWHVGLDARLVDYEG